MPTPSIIARPVSTSFSSCLKGHRKIKDAVRPLAYVWPVLLCKKKNMSANILIFIFARRFFFFNSHTQRRSYQRNRYDNKRNLNIFHSFNKKKNYSLPMMRFIFAGTFTNPNRICPLALRGGGVCVYVWKWNRCREFVQNTCTQVYKKKTVRYNDIANALRTKRSTRQ